jgi:prephenate dehydrogenase
MESQLNYPEKMTVVGTGTFGEPLVQYLQDCLNTMKIDGIDKDPEKGNGAIDSEEAVVEKLEIEDPDVVVMAISAENQATEGVQMMKEWLGRQCDVSDVIKMVVQINSVQSGVRNALVETLSSEVVHEDKPVVVISLHPNHGAAAFENSADKVWILSGISVLGGVDEDKKDVRQWAGKLVRSAVSQMREVHGEKGKVQLVDLTGGYENGDLLMDGPEYHDYIAAYYQAIFHMVKLIPGMQSKQWYKDHFGDVRASDELSEEIVASNPYASELAVRFQQLAYGNYSVENILSVVWQLLDEGEEKIPDRLEVLKTVNVKKLQSLAEELAKYELLSQKALR